LPFTKEEKGKGNFWLRISFFQTTAAGEHRESFDLSKDCFPERLPHIIKQEGRV